MDRLLILIRIMLVSVWLFPATVTANPGHGVVQGVLRDADDGSPLSFASVLLTEVSLSTMTAEDGSFRIDSVPEGDHTLRTFRIGYDSISRSVSVQEGDTLRLELWIRSTALIVGELLVEDDSDDAARHGVALVLDGRRLRQRMGSTVAETIDHEPGISMRSMGAAPARPVLRGIGGERLLVLEDGGNPGDLSGTSADHALVVDPLLADRIEVIRGPASLAFGSSVLGGVINVVRRFVPRSIPEHLHAMAMIQGESVSSGYASGGEFMIPASDRFAFRGDISFRRAGDMGTPVGPLDNTSLHTLNGSLGAGLVEEWGSVGGAIARYSTRYGIPGGFVGAHPNGVDVQAEREYAETRGEWITDSKTVSRIEARGTFTRYHHREYESSGNLGIEYGLLSYNASATAKTNLGPGVSSGAVGISAEHRDYAAGGFAFTPPAIERTLAVFAYQEMQTGRFSVEGGLRVENRIVSPDQDPDLQATSGAVRRSFSGVAGSVGLHWRPANWLSVGLRANRTTRAPGIEELYSEGPHLASYSYEIGNPDLAMERGLGIELVARADAPGIRGSISLFRNRIEDFIFPVDTGEMNHRVFLPIYQHTGALAVMNGVEGRMDIQLMPRLLAEGAASFVRGDLPELDHPIPWMPPVHGSLGVRYQHRSLSAGVSVRFAASQERIAPFETRTPGYAVADIEAGYHFTFGGLLHTVNVGVANLTDTVYRHHLSRVKSIMPEPGRNGRLLYRVYL